MLNASLAGGAARAARRLHDGLFTRGLASTFLFGVGDPPPGRGYQHLGVRRGLVPHLRRQAWRPLRIRTVLGSEVVEPWLQPDAIDFADLAALRPEVIHLHWLGSWFDAPRFLRSVPRNVPVVWTLHDLQPLTGGCHYTEGCDRFTSRCWPCPQVGRQRERLLVLASQIACAASVGPNLHLVADSHWVEAQAKASALGRRAASLRTIHYGLDLEVLRPRPRAEARTALGLPLDRPVLLFGADSVGSPRKGLEIFMRVLDRIRQAGGPTPELATFGKPPDGLPGRHLGRVDSDVLLSVIYSAADLYVTTAREEAFGQTSAEALACGTPVAAFAVGGHVDQVVDGRNGLLVTPGDESAMASQVSALLSDEATLLQMRSAARESALERFSAERECARYRELYEEVLRRPFR